MNARRLVGVLSVLAAASAVSSTFAGTVDVAASEALCAEHTNPQWPVGLAQPLAKRGGPGDHLDILETQSVSLDEPGDSFDWLRTGPFDTLRTGSNNSDGALILDLARRSTYTSPAASAGQPTAGIDSPERGGLAASLADDNARALALPDALRMFPLGALVAGLAIRRMQRSARRA